MCLYNIVVFGKFFSDCIIMEYVIEIWGVGLLGVKFLVFYEELYELKV